MKILNDLLPTREYIDAILAIATQCLNDCEFAPEMPPWCISMELLSKKAIEQLDILHDKLTAEETARNKHVGL